MTGYEIVDLSQPLTEAAPRSKLHADLRIGADVMELGGCRIRVTHMQGPVHVGTHYDAPLHFVEGGRSIDSYPPERFMTHAVAARLPQRGVEGVTAADLEAALPAVERGDFVLLSFGNAARFMSPDYHECPYLTAEACEYLVQLGVGAVGTDTISPDGSAALRGPGFDFPAHRTLLENGILILENLGVGLERIVGERVLLVAPPLPLVGADGAMTVPYAFRPRA